MRIWIKSGMRATVTMFRRGNDEDFERVNRIDAYNHEIADRIFNGIMKHDFDYAYIRHDFGTLIFTRSTRGNCLRASRLAKDGIFNGHAEIKTVKEMERELIEGHYITIRKF